MNSWKHYGKWQNCSTHCFHKSAADASKCICKWEMVKTRYSICYFWDAIAGDAQGRFWNIIESIQLKKWYCSKWTITSFSNLQLTFNCFPHVDASTADSFWTHFWTHFWNKWNCSLWFSLFATMFSVLFKNDKHFQ